MHTSPLPLLALTALLTACTPSGRPISPEAPAFTTSCLSAYTLPAHQGRTSTCWAFATNALLESAWLQRHPGDTLRLSPMYIVRHNYLQQMAHHYYTQGSEPLRSGGLAHDYLRVAQEKGLMPMEAYPGKPEGQRLHDHRKLLKALRKLAHLAVVRRDLPTSLAQAEALLDRELGAVPDSFLYRGKRYTPRSFAQALHLPTDSCLELTSFTHLPERKEVVLEVPDNWAHARFLNLPLDELERRVAEALRRGETVAWHGDISEASYQVVRGVATWPCSPVTAEMRQRDFEQFETTDDHYLLLVGMATDAAGRRYYLLKDSYGHYAPYGGLVYLSADYFRMKTLSVLLKSGS